MVKHFEEVKEQFLIDIKGVVEMEKLGPDWD